MIKNKRQEDIRNLCDLDTPMTDYDKLILLNVYGLSPERKPTARQPYDRLFLKMKRSQEI